MDGWYYVEGIIWDDKAQDLINKGWSVSCSYDYLAFNDEGGEENNIHYDKEFTQLNFTHLAIVDNPRYERANIVFNSKVGNEDSEGGRWITVKGTHIFIKDGQTLTEAMREKGMEVKQKYLDEDSEEDIDWSKEGLRTSIKEAQRDGLEAVEDIADYLGLDEDEVRETLSQQESFTDLKKKLEQYKKQALEGDNSTIVRQIIEGLEKKIADIRKNPTDYIKSRAEEAQKNKTNNSKEQDMAIIEELKKLIFKVENNKENEIMVENEKVDKRKLIDEVAGIMKSAGCDDEDIRTAIGKMEKIGYDESEAGSADNKKVKNEMDEKEEDKKVDNEEDEEKEEKEEEKVDNESEEDEEKVEELKEEEKKDVDNKCKNSKEESYFDKINKIYNSAKKIEEPSVEYESKQARLDAGKEYFG